MDAQSGYDAVLARDEVFSPAIFKYAEIGPKLSSNKYMQTAIFANMPMANMATVTYPQTTQTGRYYEVVDVVIAGKIVKVVSTHLDFNQGNTDEQREQSHQNRIAQINKLIDDFADDPYVLICADFNVWAINVDDYELFKDAGYDMISHGYMGDILTYPAGDSPVHPLDNIVYKGFVSHKIDVLNDDTLSDHMCVFADFTMIL